MFFRAVTTSLMTPVPNFNKWCAVSNVLFKNIDFCIFTPKTLLVKENYFLTLWNFTYLKYTSFGKKSCNFEHGLETKNEFEKWPLITFFQCIVTGNLKIISVSRIRNIVSKGPKYRLPSYINFDKLREEIASALNEFGIRWCKRECVEDGALKAWKRSIFTIVDKRIKFYSQNTNLLPPKPKSSFRHLKQGIQEFHRK